MVSTALIEATFAPINRATVSANVLGRISSKKTVETLPFFAIAAVASRSFAEGSVSGSTPAMGTVVRFALCAKYAKASCAVTSSLRSHESKVVSINVPISVSSLA